MMIVKAVMAMTIVTCYYRVPVWRINNTVRENARPYNLNKHMESKRREE